MITTDKVQTGRRREFPDPMVIIFYILLLCSLLTIVVPQGSFERVEVDGRQRVVPDSFTITESDASLSISGVINFVFDIFTSIPRGMAEASQYLLIVFIAGGMFHVMAKSRAMEHALGTMLNRVGLKNKTRILWVGTFIYGLLGIAVGYEGNIALIPVGIMIATALGYSNLVGVCMAVGGIGIGFALSPINPYTVGVSQSIAELPLFSGGLYRLFMVLVSLTLLALYITRIVVKRSDAAADTNSGPKQGGFEHAISDYRMRRTDKIIIGAFATGMVMIAGGSYLAGTGTLGRSWFINEISAIFLLISIISGFASKMSPNEYVANMIEGASRVTAGALVIGLAAAIKVVLRDGGIIDTIIFSINNTVASIPLQFLAPAVSVVQGIINFFIPSGSGQALVTMPILVPLADLTGMNRQLMILAFQVGDGLTNIIIPTSGGTLAMLALGGIPYTQWIRVIMPFFTAVFGLAMAFLYVGHYIGY